MTSAQEMISTRTLSCFAQSSARLDHRKDRKMRSAPIKWPDDAKIAVSFFIAFEAFNKYSQYRRGGDKPDYASLAYGEYGGKAGIWRIMDVLDRNDVKGTIDTIRRVKVTIVVDGVR